MLPTALVPVRTGPWAKRRLAHVLAAHERTQLVTALFRHVVEVLLDSGLPVVALSPGSIEAPAEIEEWRDEADGLNGAVAAALRRLENPVLVIHADLPLVGADDIDHVLGCSADVVIARARDGGTNGLLLRRAMRPSFGPGSALIHAGRARAAGLRAAVVDTPGFACDVDDEAALSVCGNAWRRGTRP